MHPTPFRYLFALTVFFAFALGFAALAAADGPPPATLAPAPAAEAADSLAARAMAEIDDAAYRATRPANDGHPLLRKIALASAAGFAGLALWRESVAADREADYENAILPERAVQLRESVRDAEHERNLFASLSAAGLSVVVLTFVY